MTTFRNSLPLKAYYFGLIGLLYLPIAILFLFSINANTFLSFPLQGLTLDWYEKLFASDALLRSARNSLVVALGSSLTATLMGTMVGLLMMRYQFRSKGLLVAMAVLFFAGVAVAYRAESAPNPVAAGLGVGIVAESEFGDDRRLVPLPFAGSELQTTEYVACLAERRELRLVHAFLDIVERTAPTPAHGASD